MAGSAAGATSPAGAPPWVAAEVHLAPARRWAALAAMLGATFVGTINNSMANVAIPSIAEDLDVELSAAVWVVSSFSLSLGVAMPLAGRLGDVFGARRVFLSGMVLFVGASVLAGAGGSIAPVVAGRALQGAAGSPVLPCIMVTVARLFPAAQRRRAIGMWAAVNAAALAAGPFFGGVVADAWGWRQLFYLSAPASLLVAVAVFVLVPEDPPTVRRHVDLVGALLLAAGIAAFATPFAQGHAWGWTDPRILGLLAASVASVVVLRWHLRREREPFIEPALLADRAFRAVTAIAGLQMIALFAVTLLVPVFFVVGLGEPAATAGFVTSALPASMVVGALLSGHIGTRVRFPHLATGGALGMAAGLATVALAAPSMRGVACGLVLIGLGISFIQAPAAAAVAFVTPAQHAGVGAGVFNTARFVLGGIGATLAAVVFTAVTGGQSSEDMSLGTALSGFRTALLVALLAVVAILVAARALRSEWETTVDGWA